MKIDSWLIGDEDEFLSLRARAEAFFALVEAAPEEPAEGEDGRIALLRRIRRAERAMDRHAPRPDWPAWQFYSGDYACDLLAALFRMTLDARAFTAAMALAIVYGEFAEAERRPEDPAQSIAQLARALVHYEVGEYGEAARLAGAADEFALVEFGSSFSGLLETKELLIRRSEAGGQSLPDD